MTIDQFAGAYAFATRVLLTEATEVMADLVIGLGIGPLRILGDLTDLRLKVYLSRESPIDFALLGLAAFGVPIEPVVLGEFRFLAGPVGGGNGGSAGPGAQIERNSGNGTGTLGAVVVDSAGKRYILSCTHVLEGDGAVNWVQGGNDTPIATGGRVIPLDQEPIPADAGIAEITGAVSSRFSIPVASDTVNPKIGQHVAHFGATTPRGTGMIRDVQVNFKLKVDGRSRLFGNAMLIDENFAAKGDSGSVVIDVDQGKATGIVCARAENNGVPGLIGACPIKIALSKLGVNLVVT